MVPGDIVTTKHFYKLRGHNSTYIDRRRGSGRVLAYLLKHAGKRVGLGVIEGISGWTHTRRCMKELTTMIEIWPKDYKIVTENAQGKAYYYTLQKVRSGKKR